MPNLFVLSVYYTNYFSQVHHRIISDKVALHICWVFVKLPFEFWGSLTYDQQIIRIWLEIEKDFSKLVCKCKYF